MKNILFTILLVCLTITINAKSLIVKTKYLWEVNVNTKISTPIVERITYFEFDPEDTKTIIVNENGNESTFKVLKFKMNNNGDIVQIDFNCQNKLSIIYTWDPKQDSKIITFYFENDTNYRNYSNVKFQE